MSLSTISRKACRGAALVFALALAGALLGCSSDKKEANLVCPRSAITPSLGEIPIFGPGPGHALSDVRVSGQITSITSACERIEGGILVRASIAFLAKRVSTATEKTELPYFVAVADTRQHILAKQPFILKLTFPAGQGYTIYTDKVTVRLPLNSVAAGGEFIILTGFQLDKDQLDILHNQKPR